jgi:ribosomal protein S12 methylthiotransferase
LFASQDISYYILSLGCSKNTVDSERINGAMRAAGYVTSVTTADADIIIINTCGFIEAAKNESIAAIFDALGIQAEANSKSRRRSYGRRDDGSGNFVKRVAVVGCLTQRYAREIETEIPEIDFTCGIPDDEFVVRMSARFNVAIRPLSAPQREPLYSGSAYAYIKISDGCSNNCSYCAIPLIRGSHSSYPREFVLGEACRAAARGARELVVVAQDISAYRWGNADLKDIILDMSMIDGIEWIRLMYCHPDHLDENIFNILADVEKVVHYIDIPFQHASGGLLRSMGRKGDGAAYLALIARLRERVPDIRIRSTFMVGFPGETGKDFNELVDFLDAARLDRVGAFEYSPEEGTRAYAMGDTVSGRIKKQRYNRLMDLQREISAGKLKDMVGRVVRVVAEERIDDATWSGRSEYDAPEVDGIFYLTGAGVEANSIVAARVTDAMEYDLVGEIIE